MFFAGDVEIQGATRWTRAMHRPASSATSTETRWPNRNRNLRPKTGNENKKKISGTETGRWRAQTRRRQIVRPTFRRVEVGRQLRRRKNRWLPRMPLFRRLNKDRKIFWPWIRIRLRQNRMRKNAWSKSKRRPLFFWRNILQVLGFFIPFNQQLKEKNKMLSTSIGFSECKKHLCAENREGKVSSDTIWVWHLLFQMILDLINNVVELLKYIFTTLNF